MLLLLLLLKTNCLSAGFWGRELGEVLLRRRLRLLVSGNLLLSGCLSGGQLLLWLGGGRGNCCCWSLFYSKCKHTNKPKTNLLPLDSQKKGEQQSRFFHKIVRSFFPLNGRNFFPFWPSEFSGGGRQVSVWESTVT